MKKTFFSQFPITQYGNNFVVDITERVIVKMNSTSLHYYPHDVTGTRPDTLAYQLYGDPYTSWIFYLTNRVIDPYYDWTMRDDEFNRYIQLKYGSTANAMNTIAYYVNDWQDRDEIEPAAFNAMTPVEQDYWEPRYGYFNSPIAYTRRQINWKASTNFVLNIGIGTGNTVPFQDDEPVQISYLPGSNGAAQVVESNTTLVTVQHVSGDSFPDANNGVAIGPSSFMYGVSSGACTSITTCSIVANVIAADIQSYYSPVYWYDIERDRVVNHSIVNVLEPAMVTTIVEMTNALLSSTNAATVIPG